jgi:hypothetical protein
MNEVRENIKLGRKLICILRVSVIVLKCIKEIEA